VTRSLDASAERLLRDLTPQVLGAAMRRFGDFAACEDAVQEALVAAAEQWPRRGVPDDARAWLIRVASRRMTDQLRSEEARRRREAAVADEVAHDRSARLARAIGGRAGEAQGDDSLILLFMCCHEALTRSSAIALTLRAVGGLTTAEIANAFLVPEATMAQRISRAKSKIKEAGASFSLPTKRDRAERLASVVHVLYLIFNEGYTSSFGPNLHREELSSEAIRLTRLLHRQLPDEPEVEGLLALMLLTDARRAARTGPHGELIPLAEQDRRLWDGEKIAEGVALVSAALPKGAVGPYQLQAAIAAVHDEAARVDDTDWPQILALYGVLERVSDNPMVTLNRAVVHGPAAGLELLRSLDGDRRLEARHRLDAVRAHLLELAGQNEAAAAHFASAAGRATNIPERNYLLTRAARLSGA
jgi:RNA polymerase sigma factor (sigma-70 family)